MAPYSAGDLLSQVKLPISMLMENIPISVLQSINKSVNEIVSFREPVWELLHVSYVVRFNGEMVSSKFRPQ